MINLTFEQKQSLGLQYLLDEVSCNCVFGQELLKNTAPYEPKQFAELQTELERLSLLVESYEEKKDFWDGVEHILMNLKEIRGSLKNARAHVLTDLELFELKHFLLQMEKMRQWYQNEQAVSLGGIVWQDTTGALNLLDPEKRRLPGFYLADAYAPDLAEVREEKKRIEVLLRQEHGKEDTEKWLKLRQDAVAREEKIQQRIRSELTEQLQPWLDAMEQDCRVAGQLDYLLQKARLALKHQGIRPRIRAGEERKLCFCHMINPAVAESLKERGKAFTPISFSMEQGCAAITGANMGGKSVALRTLALNVVLAQSGFFVYAAEASMPMFDAICLVAEEYQSMKNGLSSFGGEIMELQKALDRQKEGFCLLIFDELARGTNPDEGASIVRATVQYLKEKPCMAIFATHYDHVAEYADYHYQVAGLRGVDLTQLAREIKDASSQKGIDIIAKYMNYGIYQVHGKEECPRDAIHICGLLGLEPALLKLIQ